MKVRMFLLAMIAVLGMTALADAKGSGTKHGTRGTIATIDATKNSFTMTVGNKKTGTQTITVNAANASISIEGSASAFTSLAAGQKVSVVGDKDADTINASAITCGAHKKHKENAA